MNIAIVGSRRYPDLDAVIEYVNNLPEGTVVVSGGSSGVDDVAERAAKARGLDTLIFPVLTHTAPGVRPTAQQYAIAAKRRNQQIVDAADKVVAFWDGSSAGTADTIHKARKADKLDIVVKPGEDTWQQERLL